MPFRLANHFQEKNEHLLGTNPGTMDLSVVLKGVNYCLNFTLLAYHLRRQTGRSSKNGIIVVNTLGFTIFTDYDVEKDTETLNPGTMDLSVLSKRIKDRGYLQHKNDGNQDVYADLVVPFINF